MPAYYNEIDPFAAQWLRNLIARGHVAPGDVDERSIAEVSADDTKGYTQCHFFAGIGVWSHALRRAGWEDDRPIWTGSCPCQPFSAAGKQGGFDDARHLWPVWYDLLAERRPPVVVVGEQVASALDWLDLVSADMEGAGYAFGASDLCAAGFGGAHIRQRLYFVGLADSAHQQQHRSRYAGPGWRSKHPERGGTSGVAQPDGGQRSRITDGEGRLVNREAPRQFEGDGQLESGSDLCGMGDADAERRDREHALLWENTRGRNPPELPETARRSSGSRLADADGREHRQTGGVQPSRKLGLFSEDRSVVRQGYIRPQPDLDERRPCAPNLGGHPVDWLLCRDGKWRPVEPGAFPLAHAAPARVGRLRAYGNALDAKTATQFLGAVRQSLELIDLI